MANNGGHGEGGGSDEENEEHGGNGKQVHVSVSGQSLRSKHAY
jgi:hypothetical protein